MNKKNMELPLDVLGSLMNDPSTMKLPDPE
jgi:hypothetical protein